jgi:hypothetical protein
MRKNWTKIMALLACLSLCLSLCVGCGGEKTADTTEETETPTEDATEPQETQEPEKAVEIIPTEEPSVQLPFDEPLEMLFASGAGGWGTVLTLNPDGSFTGEFSDSEMGDSGDDYPKGTVYLCDFAGQFTDIQQVDDHTYSLTLEDLTITTENEEEEWIEDGIRYVADTPYGFEEGKDFLFYTPETPVEGLEEEFVWWWPHWNYQTVYGQDPDTLCCYGLRNLATDQGFFTYD